MNGKVLFKWHRVVDLGTPTIRSFTEQVSKQTSEFQRLMGCIIRNLFRNDSCILMQKYGLDQSYKTEHLFLVVFE